MTETQGFAATPEPPYYAVIFTSELCSDDPEYSVNAAWMVALASEMPGFLGIESVRGMDGVGITISYWRDEASIAAWKANADHRMVRERGRADWYDRFEVRIAKIERAYGWIKQES